VLLCGIAMAAASLDAAGQNQEDGKQTETTHITPPYLAYVVDPPARKGDAAYTTSLEP
jgi:hypothetical protein